MKSNKGRIYNSTDLLDQGAWHAAKGDKGAADLIQRSANFLTAGTGALLKTLLHRFIFL